MSQDRLHRVLEPSFVQGLPDISTEELRQRRAEAEAEEEAISYVRRLLQGRLDILRAELMRRESDGSGPAADLLAGLSAVLSEDQPAGGRDAMSARSTRLRVPEGITVHEQELDAVLDASALDELEGRTLQTLKVFVDRLSEHERSLSETRRVLFDRIDALRSELAARYKDGRAVVSDLLTEH